MKKRLFLMGLVASVLLLSSCNKDDMELLKRPYRVQGSLNPTYRLPLVSSGQLNLGDLLKTFDGTLGANMVVTDTVIIFYYDMSVRDSIEVGVGSKKAPTAPMKRGAVKGRTGDIMLQVDTTLSYTVPIDLFDKAEPVKTAGSRA